METILTPPAEHLEIDGITLSDHPKNGKRVFPDGEGFVQLEGLENVEEATVIHSGMPEPDQGLQFLYGVLELLKQNNIETQLVFTYFPYSMQDAEFFPGTLNRTESIIRKLENYYKVRSISVIDPHFGNRNWLRKHEVKKLRSFPLIQEKLDDDFLVVGPDLGAEKRFDIDSFRKKRIHSEKVSIEGELDVEGRKVVVFDDIVETGGTMCSAYEKLVEQGAEKVVAAAVHGVMEKGCQRVSKTFDDFYLTNTVDNPYTNLKVEPLIREIL